MKIWLTAFVIVASLLSSAQAELKILFIGNSFTLGGTRSVPVIFDRLAIAGEQGDPTTVMRAVSGQDFQYHSSSADTLAAIAQAPWDYVVLQNYSTDPTHINNGQGITDHYTYGTSLYNTILLSNPNTHIVLFETWSRASAHSLITGTSTNSTYASTAQMQSELRTNYRGLADTLNAANPSKVPVVVSPVGTAWENAGGLRAASDPAFVDLHGDDLYHGDDDGYYLTAATLYSTIFGKSPEGLSTNPQLTSLGLVRNVDATRLEKVAWSTAQAVPEPTTAIFLLLGTIGLGVRRPGKQIGVL